MGEGFYSGRVDAAQGATAGGGVVGVAVIVAVVAADWSLVRLVVVNGLGGCRSIQVMVVVAH